MYLIEHLTTDIQILVDFQKQKKNVEQNRNYAPFKNNALNNLGLFNIAK